MHAFYLEGKGAVGELAPLPKDEAKHALKVLRLGVGDEICAMDKAGGRFAAVIEEIGGDAASVRLAQALPSNEPPVRLTLYQGLPKSDKLYFIVQKLTELGAARLVPVKMERSVVKLNDRDGQKKQERLQKIAREAAKQCKRGGCLEVTAPQTWKQLRESMAAHDLLLVPWEDARGFGLKAARAAFPEAKDVGIVIGPEGGMSENEVRALEELGAKQITLGPRILRTETAAIAAATMAMLLWGDIG